jgi:predicted phage tail protein
MAGAGAVGRIIAGAVLVAVGLFVPGIGALGVQLIVGVGASLILGGVAQLLTPVPTMNTGKDSEKDPRKSYSFSGIQQTSRQGVPVPIVYGETLVGSVVISAGIDTVQVSA